jgi:hypothetical protein
LLSSSGGQAVLVPGLALWLIKNFVSLQQDGQAEVILIPRLTQSRFVMRNVRFAVCYRADTAALHLHIFVQLCFQVSIQYSGGQIFLQLLILKSIL